MTTIPVCLCDGEPTAHTSLFDIILPSSADSGFQPHSTCFLIQFVSDWFSLLHFQAMLFWLHTPKTETGFTTFVSRQYDRRPNMREDLWYPRPLRSHDLNSTYEFLLARHDSMTEWTLLAIWYFSYTLEVNWERRTWRDLESRPQDTFACMGIWCCSFNIAIVCTPEYGKKSYFDLELWCVGLRTTFWNLTFRGYYLALGYLSKSLWLHNGIRASWSLVQPSSVRRICLSKS